MRVISGKYKGRNIKGYNINGTRPTQDRVKESLFSMIQTYLNESICLDLFAGSGNLGIESLSNNASFCYFVDNSNKAINIINENLLTICQNDKDKISKVLKLDYKSALINFKENNIKFNIIFIDPPYKTNYILDILEYIDKFNLLMENGLIVVEYETDNFTKDFSNIIEYKSKKYGYKFIKIYKRK